MRIDLESALGSIASAAESSAGPVPVERLLRRMRHRRAARAAATSAAGIGTAGAVAWGAVALTDGPGPRAGWPSDSAPPSTAASSGDLPPAARAGTPFACGSPVPTIDDPAGTADLHLEARGRHEMNGIWGPGEWEPLDGMRMISGEEFSVDVVLVNGTAEEVNLTAFSDSIPSAWLTQEGVVVAQVSGAAAADGQPLATPAMGPPTDENGDPLPPPPPAVISGGPGPLWSVQGGGRPWLCSEPGAPMPEDTLPTGEYDVYVTTSYFPEVGGTQPLLSRTDEVIAVAGPYRLVVEPDPAAPTEAPPLEMLSIGVGGLHPGGNPLHENLNFFQALPAEPGPTELVRWDEDRCPRSGEPGRWVATYPDRSDLRGDSISPFTVTTSGGRITRIAVQTPGIRSSAGIEVGATRAELLAAHPELVLEYAAVTGSDGTAVDILIKQHNELVLAFEVAVRTGSGLDDPALVDRVVAITAQSGGPTSEPVHGSDPCR